ncbi:MAG: DNA alkylation repair protein [Candidatus Heimdallarchaeota archaeon]|nr:MAG: DNA alkylation repair protein [Candidatus Heimdallarchaeota archaeon]
MTELDASYLNDLVTRVLADLKKVNKEFLYGSIHDTIDEYGYKRLGIRVPAVRKVASPYWKELREKGIRDADVVFRVCEHLYSTRIAELRLIATDWSFKVKKQFESSHFSILESWIDTYLFSWGSIDSFCTRTMGYFLLQYPEFIPDVKRWTQSSNPWVRRAAAVSFIYALRREKYLQHCFEVANTLLNDPDLYVLKGYGWMLKEASNKFREEVFEYVLANKSTMPRVSLRYSIEKMPIEMRKKAMEK